MLAEINEKAWRVSAYALLKRKRWEVCSTGKIRELYEEIGRGGENFVNAITTIVKEYTPPEDKKRNEQVFKAFSAKLVEELEGMRRPDAKQLLEYVLWDIQDLGRLFKDIKKENELRTKLKCRFTAEGMKEMNIVDEIVKYWKKEGGIGTKKGGYEYKKYEKRFRG